MNYRVQLLCSLLFLLSVINNISAQSITELNGQYVFQEKVYEFDELRDIIRDKPNALFVYDKAIKSKKETRNYAYSAATLASIGIIAYIYREEPSRSCEFFCFSWGEYIGKASLFVLTPVSIGITLISNSLFQRKKRKAITEFNKYHSPSQNQYKWSLDIESTTSGLSLVLRF